MDSRSEIGQDSPEKFARSEKIEPGSDGWLSPSGGFIKTTSSQHDESAEWIIDNNLCELNPYFRRFSPDVDKWKNSELSHRHFLLKNGWILINGPIFHTDNALNYTTDQLTKLSEANIPIIGAYDGSKELSVQETLDWISMTATNISEFIESQELVDRFGNKMIQEEFWRDIKDRGYSTLEDFKKNPFKTRFGDFGQIAFTDVRDILTKGYSDEIVFDYGMDTYTLRLIKLNSGERICMEYTFHHHDRDSGNEEHMNVYVVDNFTFKEKINKYLSSGIEPKIKGDYLRKLIEEDV